MHCRLIRCALRYISRVEPIKDYYLKKRTMGIRLPEYTNQQFNTSIKSRLYIPNELKADLSNRNSYDEWRAQQENDNRRN